MNRILHFLDPFDKKNVFFWRVLFLLSFFSFSLFSHPSQLSSDRNVHWFLKFERNMFIFLLFLTKKIPLNKSSQLAFWVLIQD